MISIILLAHISIGIGLIGYSLVSVLRDTASKTALQRIAYLLSGSILSGLGLAVASSSVNLLAVCRNLIPYLVIISIVSWLHMRKDPSLNPQNTLRIYRESAVSFLFVIVGLALGF